MSGVDILSRKISKWLDCYELDKSPPAVNARILLRASEVYRTLLRDRVRSLERELSAIQAESGSE